SPRSKPEVLPVVNFLLRQLWNSVFFGDKPHQHVADLHDRRIACLLRALAQSPHLPLCERQPPRHLSSSSWERRVFARSSIPCAPRKNAPASKTKAAASI